MPRPEDDRSEDGSSSLVPDCGDAIDPATFEQILEMDDDAGREFSRELVFGFFDQASQTLSDMEAQIKEKDLGRLGELGHYLKGSSATLGLTKVRDSCEKIQHFGALKDEHGNETETDEVKSLKKIADTLPVLKEDCADAEKRLRAFYDNL